MSRKHAEAVKTKLNISGLISFLLFFLIFPLLLIPWQYLFVLRSNTLSPLVIHIIGLFVIGILMLALGIVAIVMSKKNQGKLRGTWMGIVGLVLGVVFVGFSGFIIVDYLINGLA